MRSICFILFAFNLASAAPKPPAVWKLSPKEIQEIAIHSEINTLLIFPKEVTLSMGHGLTDGSAPGVVLQEPAQDKRVLVWRHLGGTEKILVQVMLGKKAYAFRVVPSSTPESIIHFVEEGKAERAKKVTLPQVGVHNAALSQLEKRELLNLAGSSAILKDRIPHKYEGFQEKGLTDSFREGDLEFHIRKTARFANQDALVMIGTITNKGEEIIRPNQRKAFLLVGSKRHYRLSDIRFGINQVSPGQISSFEMILVGDGQGNPAHLSLENRFRIRLHP